MIIDRIEPIALRIARPGADPFCLTLAKVTTRDGIAGYGECLSLRPPMQRALFATIRDAIAPHYLGKSVEQKEALNLAPRRRFASSAPAPTALTPPAPLLTPPRATPGKP